MDGHESLIYRLNEHDQICFVGEGWARFAEENDAPGLADEKVLNLSLWDFINDLETAHLYREIVRRAREGRRVGFRFRCDSPARRRLLRMEVTAHEGGGVQFETVTLRAEQRPYQPLLDVLVPRTKELLRVCSWCKKFDVGGGTWEEVEVAVARLGLFEREGLPRLTHGMCRPCHLSISERLSAIRSGDGRAPQE
ncbi:MAG: hypothetical protein JOZ96_22705 [Acidobacteria bacterium]|nr:hypothetical protein [Acidobacteriota bacterium]MBV9927848.1 hypothetical protein [Acidobacteriota bacterium]